MALRTAGCWVWILVFGFWIGALAQDAGDIVNALDAHTEECGTHEWQVVDVGDKCGTKACKFPQNWCSSEGGSLSCVPLSSACQNRVKDEVTPTTAAAATTTPAATKAASTTTTTEATSTSSTTAATSPADTTTTTSTEGPTIAPGTLPALFPGTAPTPEPLIVVPGERPPRPLPVGPDGKLLVFFKVVGNERPNCPDNSNFCCAWARSNECNDNAFFMQTYCRRSCQELRRGGPDAVGRPQKPGGLITIGGDQLTIGENAFGDPPGGTCQDLHPKCRLWASRGECKRNSLYMISMCRPACGLCPPCVPKCEMTCPGGYGEGISLYGGSSGGGCQQKCSGCAGR